MALATTIGAALARPDLNAFLNRKVSTTAELVSQAETDSVVMDRYERHFGMGREEVVTYLRSLHPGVLKEDWTCKIYSVPDAGYVKTHVGRLKKGTKMFFTADEEPALVALCGNPVTEGKTPTLVAITPDAPVAVGDAKPLAVVATTPEPMLAMAQPADIELPDVTGGHDNQPISPGISGFPLAGLLGLGAFGLISTHTHTHNTPAPEPATVAVFAVGMGAIIRKRRVNR